jgi:hypothetical protein
MSRWPGSELDALRAAAEENGASFHVATEPRALSALVTAADDVLVMAEGVLAPAETLAGLTDEGPFVAVLPAETAVPAGFERIDINRAWAGAMLLPGRLVDRLMDLPDDVDAASSLLRIALQASVPLRNVPARMQEPDRWPLIRTEHQAQAAEERWIGRLTASGSRTPGPMLARLFVRKVGPALLHGNSGTMIAAVGAAIVAAFGFAAARFGHPAPGLVLVGFGWVMRCAASLLQNLEDEMLARVPRHVWRRPLFDVALDFLIAGMLVLALPDHPGQTLLERWFEPLALLGLIRLLSGTWGSDLAPWLADRLVLCGLLALMTAGGVAYIGVPALALLLIGAGVLLADRSPQSPRG